MYCPRCHAALEREDRRCWACGRRLGPSITRPAAYTIVIAALAITLVVGANRLWAAADERGQAEEARKNAPVTTANGNTVTEGNAGSERAAGTIASGSEISLYSGQRVCTNTYNVGDRFTASVAESVQGSNGVAIPAGATAVIEITSLKRSENANDNIAMEFVVRSIAFNGTTYPVNSTVTAAQVDKVRNGDASNDGKKVATGAIIGAIAGQIFGHHTKSTVIGAATGAAAGAVVAGATGKYDGCVPNGGRISLRLTQPMTVQQSV